MSEWKEVWHVWDGVGAHPITSKVEAVLSVRGRVSRVDRRDDDETFRNEFLCLYWGREDDMKSGWNLAYTTGQKRRRVDCVECKDSKYKGLVYCGGYFEYRKCPSCNGKGMVWEYDS